MPYIREREHLAATACELTQLSGRAICAAQEAATQAQAAAHALPRREIRHEPESVTCSCGCTLQRIGEDMAKKLDYGRAARRASSLAWLSALLLVNEIGDPARHTIPQSGVSMRSPK